MYVCIYRYVSYIFKIDVMDLEIYLLLSCDILKTFRVIVKQMYCCSPVQEVQP